MKNCIEMFDILLNLFLHFVTLVYEKLFHEKISNGIEKFATDVFYYFIATVTATIFSFTFNVLAGRILGPHEYGTFILVQSIAMFLYIPMRLGITTGMVKYTAENSDFSRQQTIITTSYILILALTIFSVTIYYLFLENFYNLFLVSQDLFCLAVIFAILFIFYITTTNTLRSLHEMKMLSVFKVLNSILLLVIFLLLINGNTASFRSIIFSINLTYAIIGGTILLYLRKYFIFDFNYFYAKKLLRYGLWAAFSGVSFILYTNIDKLLINKYMSVTDVGLYNAYYYSSINLTSIFSGIFVTVFFPTVSKYKDKSVILTKLNKLVRYAIICCMPFVLISEYIVLYLFGNEYPAYIGLMLIFALTSVLSASYSVYAWFFNSEGEKGAKSTLIGTGTIGLINIILNILLIPSFGLYGAIGSTLIAYCIGTVVIHKYGKKNLLF